MLGWYSLTSVPLTSTVEICQVKYVATMLQLLMGYEKKTIQGI